MARTKTLLALRTEIYNRGEVSSVYIDSTEMNQMVNGSYAELYDLIVANNKDYYLDSQLISVVSGTIEYALDSDFYKVSGVDIKEGTRWYRLKRYNHAERNQYQNGTDSKRHTRYRAMGSNIRLRPTPRWSGTNDLKLWFIPTAPVLSDDGDTVDGICGWDEYIVVDVLIKVREKQEEDITGLVKQKADLKRRIESASSDRDDNEPDRIRDVSAEAYEYDFLVRD